MDSKEVKDPQWIKIHRARVKARFTKPTCVDLFAGAGGLAVGFRKAGWNVIGGNDSDVDAGATFRRNFKDAVFFEGPVSALTTEMILNACGLAPGDLDCLIGGPPCQSFSYNNHQRSEKDTRARLFEHYLRLVAGLKPKTLVMENVPGILTIGDGSVIEAIRTELKVLDYECEVRVLSAEEYGTPQVRRRVFIVASRIGAPGNMIPLPSHRSVIKSNRSGTIVEGRLLAPVTVDSAIGDLPALGNGGGELVADRVPKRGLSPFQLEARRGTRKVYNHVCHALKEANLKRIRHVPEGGNWRDVPRDLLPAGMQRARLSDHTKRYGRLSRDGLASTILTKCDPHWGAYVHPTEHRTISVREAARLQGFPDSFRFAGTSLGKHYEQVGNAVPIPVATALGAAVAAHLADTPTTLTKAPSTIATEAA